MKKEFGIFKLNGIWIKWSFDPNYISENGHFEFKSMIDSKPNSLTRTGYRSDFPMENIENPTEHVIEFLKSEIDSFVLEIDGKIIKHGEKIQCSLEAFK